MKEKFNCYLCNNEDLSIVANQDQIRFGCYGFKKYVAKCSKCGLVQLYPQWKDEELKKLYSRYSQKKDFAGHKRKEDRSPYLEKLIKKTDFVLEIGCGLGGNLRRLRRRGYNVIGIDKEPAVCDEKIIFNYDFKDFFPDNGKFDFIYAIQVFEHIFDPLEFIGWIYHNLNEKGKFLLEVPNIDDPLLKIYKINKFKKFYWYPYHAFFYDKNSIGKIFQTVPKLHIEVTLLQRYGLINHLRWLILKRPGNVNWYIPVLDGIYKFILTRLFKLSDTMIVLGVKKRSE